MIRDIDGSPKHPIRQKCNIVYEYLRQYAAIHSPSKLIQKFQNLLQQGRNEDSRVSQALEKIITTEQEQFNLFLSQCFYLILDVLVIQPESQLYFCQLLNTLEITGKSRSYDRRRKQLIQLIQNYQRSESFQQLELIIAILNPYQTIASNFDNAPITNQSTGSISEQKTPLINDYLIRYTFLYQYFIPPDLDLANLINQIKQLQGDRQQGFEINLSKHIIYRFRLKQLAKMKMMAKGAGKMITKADNPSLLSERAFRVALQQYVGKLDSGKTLLERSQHFVAQNEYRQTYKAFKQDLYSFLTSNIKPRNNTYQFASRLQQKLLDIFPQANEKPLNRTQILQTCRQLYSFLIIDSTSGNNPEQFAELIANLGTAQVMLILTKIALICPESKADLEKKIYLIVIHYRYQTVQQVAWLLKTLEHLLMAFSIYFGKIDVSLAKSALNKSSSSG
ncbi:MAG: hypothetical protein AAF652_03640 [Cyanobacteria bacterium P01_C01_bin.72]